MAGVVWANGWRWIFILVSVIRFAVVMPTVLLPNNTN